MPKHSPNAQISAANDLARKIQRRDYAGRPAVEPNSQPAMSGLANKFFPDEKEEKEVKPTLIMQPRNLDEPSIGTSQRKQADEKLHESTSLKTKDAALRAIHEKAAPGFRHVEFPSRCVPYDFKEIKIRPLEVVPDLIALSAATKTGSMTEFLDVLDNCLSVNIRDLTYSDLRFAMYWLRLNSYPNSPYKIPWTSRYGNDQEHVVSQTELTIKELDMTAEEYAVFKSKGIMFPTVRDAEILNSEEINEDDRFILDRAQYLYVTEDEIEQAGSMMKAKVDKFKATADISLLEYIRDFAEKIEHGVTETAKVTDKKLAKNLLGGAQYLRRVASLFTEIAQANSESDDPNPAAIIVHTERAAEFIKEAEEIEAEIKAADEENRPYNFSPKEEDIVLEISIMSFFPGI